MQLLTFMLSCNLKCLFRSCLQGKKIKSIAEVILEIAELSKKMKIKCEWYIFFFDFQKWVRLCFHNLFLQTASIIFPFLKQSLESLNFFILYCQVIL